MKTDFSGYMWLRVDLSPFLQISHLPPRQQDGEGALLCVSVRLRMAK